MLYKHFTLGGYVTRNAGKSHFHFAFSNPIIYLLTSWTTITWPYGGSLWLLFGQQLVTSCCFFRVSSCYYSQSTWFKVQLQGISMWLRLAKGIWFWDLWSNFWETGSISTEGKNELARTNPATNSGHLLELPHKKSRARRGRKRPSWHHLSF